VKKNKLYIKAKKIILGGNMLLSKNPDVILPDYWPSYFYKTNKTHVWGDDKKKYLDMMCYVGQNTLGYNNSSVDKEVIKKIKLGNMSTLNSTEEVELAEELLKTHKWAGMAKFARSGGEANALAVRIARASSKKDHIAICGYHGWHDWYLSVNLKNKNNLNQHLIPGLEPLGVPKYLKNTVHPFSYGNIHQLYSIIKKFDLAAVKMEVGRSTLPNIEFLNEVRELTNKKKIILIFDECTSGFRRTKGGLHLATNINPDIAMFGKALGNGFAITAVIGKTNFMEGAKKSFISSTFWTERVGFVAGLKTLKTMQKLKSWEQLIKSGKYMNEQWSKLSQKYDLPIRISGIESITQFTFEKNHNLYKTFVTQELLKKNILGSSLIFLNIHHTKKVIDSYIKELDKIFYKIKEFEESKFKKKLLIGQISKNTFKRLTD
jgi:glutamate-1-semialdehyde 2,1-aminomutase